MSTAKTFRLFISSTFSDFSEERKRLHEKVFPKIEKLCEKAGWQFQPVDLRWGVSDEAQLDQKTLELCLDEVRACKHFPHPNFLIMLGNRYGWVPLPYAIEKQEFESIIKYYQHKVDHAYGHYLNDYPCEIQLLKNWYQEDSNYLFDDSHAYVLKVRDPGGEFADWRAWAPVENSLRQYLQEAAQHIFKDKDNKEYRKYFLSATEAEVEEGIFQYLEPTDLQASMSEEPEYTNLPELDRNYVCGWIRDIENKDQLDLAALPAKLYIDTDAKMQCALEGFRATLKDALGANVKTSSVALSDDPEHPITDEAYFNAFESYIFDKLKAAVDRQFKEAEIFALEQERSEQTHFKSLKTKTFYGRVDELKNVQEYIDGDSSQPFIVHGISGIGKSAFMAKAYDQAYESLTHSIILQYQVVAGVTHRRPCSPGGTEKA